MAPIETPDGEIDKQEKKRLKKEKSEKKRAREEDAADGERKHKKSKSIAEQPSLEVKPDKKKKKDKKQKEATLEEVVPETEHKKKKKKHANGDVAVEEVDESQDKHKKKKKDKSRTEDAIDSSKKKKKSKKTEDTAQETSTSLPDPDAMEVDVATTNGSSASSKKIHQSPDAPAEPQFPFFTQTVSLYEPLYPVGWAQPVTSSQTQQLRPLLNRYVPSLRGVLLDYRNVSLGEQPAQTDAAREDDQPCFVESRNEFAVGFGWITAEVDIFMPSRGAWMEGSVNLQTEGHIGVVCFGKFNASIEARRLPKNWKWVSNESSESQGFEETASVITADEHGVVRQIHSTGFWVDEANKRVQGKIRFRIRNFDVGITGDTSYLSLEGTMLDKKAEKALVKEEAEKASLRKGKPTGFRRRIPDFATTKFAVEKEPQETEAEKPPEQPSGVFRFED